MALFKIFKGPEEGLKNVPKREGYAYFTTDKGNFYIDIQSDEFAVDGTTVTNAVGIRVQVNAKGAQGLFNKDINGSYTDNLVDIDDLMLADAKMEVDQGGTGLDTLTLNAILIGNGTDPVKMVSITDGAVVVGDSTNGVKAVDGVGAFFASAAGAPQFGILPMTAGGLGANNVAGARSNLDVYSKKEVDDAVKTSTSIAWAATLYANGWTGATAPFIYSYSNAAITCGKNGNVPPIITYTSNLEEYSNIDSAEATIGVGIEFTASKKPQNDINIVITDVK